MTDKTNVRSLDFMSQGGQGDPFTGDLSVDGGMLTIAYSADPGVVTGVNINVGTAEEAAAQSRDLLVAVCEAAIDHVRSPEGFEDVLRGVEGAREENARQALLKALLSEPADDPFDGFILDDDDDWTYGGGLAG